MCGFLNSARPKVAQETIKCKVASFYLDDGGHTTRRLRYCMSLLWPREVRLRSAAAAVEFEREIGVSRLAGALLPLVCELSDCSPSLSASHSIDARSPGKQIPPKRPRQMRSVSEGINISRRRRRRQPEKSFGHMRIYGQLATEIIILGISPALFTMIRVADCVRRRQGAILSRAHLAKSNLRRPIWTFANFHRPHTIVCQNLVRRRPTD